MPGRRDVKITGETCIRLLPFSVIKYVSSVLDIDNKWERLVMKIPRKLTELGNPNAEPRYSTLQIRLFGNAGRRSDGSPTQAIIDDWSTQNTKVRHLISVLVAADLYEAANYLSVNVLHGDRVAVVPSGGPNPALPSPEWEPNNKPNKVPLDCNINPKEVNVKPSEVVKLPVTDDIVNNVYNKLSSSADDPPYSTLNEPDVGYIRIPSYESQPSVQLDEPNGPDKVEKPSDYESAGTVHIRKIDSPPQKRVGPVENTDWHFKERHEEGVLPHETAVKAEKEPIKSHVSQNPEKNRKPCEVDEVSNDSSDIYSLIGSQEINYSLLKMITDQFDCGRLIGSGGFGDVFLGMFKNGYKVAIKKLKKMEEAAAEIEKQFRTELDSLITYRHKNIVQLYGYSVDGPSKCLVYEFLCNGSLEDRLKRVDNKAVLPNPTRIAILQGTADGIAFLNRQGIIHRDIKSANVLLDEDFLPKVGDFATARGGPRGNNTMAMSTQMVIGTTAYLAPEAMHFDVSTKLDSYSFGIVILEVLTALPPIDHDREEKDLKSHVEEGKIEELLDLSGGEWQPETLGTLMEISTKCTQSSKKRRCNVEDILGTLHSISC